MICGILTVSHLKLMILPLTNSPFLYKSSIFLWRTKELYFMIIVMSGSFMTIVVSRILSSWFKYIPHFINIIAAFVSMVALNRKPFLSDFLNALGYSFPIFLMLCSFISFIYRVVGEFSSFIFYGVPVSQFIIAHIISFLFLKKKSCKIVESLHQTPEYNVEYLDSLNITNYNAYYYLQLGLVYYCPLFLDWSLSIYLMDKFCSDGDLVLFISWFVAFFPSESSVLHQFLSNKYRILYPTVFQKCFYYQLQKIHLFRQSTISQESSRDLAKVREQSNICITQVNKFWTLASVKPEEIPLNIGSLLYSQQRIAENMWHEMNDKYPNHSKFAFEYARFLLDAKCEFKKAIKWNQKANMLESGNMHFEDKLFKSFLKIFPGYLKNKYVTTSGRLIPVELRVKKKKKLSSSSANKNTSHTDDLDNSSDIDMEDARNFIPLLDYRLPFEKSIKQLQMESEQKLYVSSTIRFIVTLIILLVIYLVVSSRFNNEVITFNHIVMLNDLMHNIEVLSHEIAWFYFSAFPELPFDFSKSMSERYFGDSADEFEYFVNISSDIVIQTINLTRICLEKLDTFAQHLYADVKISSNDMLHFNHKFSKELIDTVICTPICPDFVYYIPNATTIDFMLRSYLTLILSITRYNISQRQDFGVNNVFCEIYSHNPIIKKSFSQLLEYFSTLFDSKKNQINEEITTLFLAFTPFAMFVLLMPSTIIMTEGVKQEQKKFNQLLFSIGHDDCLNSSLPLDDSDKNLNKVHVSFKKVKSYNWVYNFITASLTAALIMIQLSISIVYFSTTSNIAIHFIMEAYQRNSLMEMGRAALYHSFYSQIEDSNFSFSNNRQIKILYFNKTTTYEAMHTNYEKYRSVQKIAESGIRKISSIYDVDREISNFRNQMICDDVNFSSYSADFYKCLSFERAIQLYIHHCQTIVHNNIHLNSQIAYEVSHLAITRLAMDYLKLFEIFTNIFQSRNSYFHVILTICFVLSLLCAALGYIIEIVISIQLKREFNCHKTLCLRIDPITFASKPQLTSYVFSSGRKSVMKMKTSAQAVFHTSHSAIFYINRDDIIENVNPASTTVFGYTPEQMLGQKLQFIISKNLNSQMYYYMELMKTGQTSIKYECPGFGVRDDGTTVPLVIALIGFSYNDKRVDFFALIMKDMTEEKKQKDAVEKEKDKAERILLQILPKDIITRIKRGDTDISFTVPSSTVVIIDVDKFSHYSAFLAPTEILESINKIFTTLNKIAALYDTITTIKVLGDKYIAVGGVFNQNIEPKEHAYQVLEFSLLCLNAIEELNIKINANLQVRIGINTGPIIAGVIGKVRPIFDIIGKTINTAEKLQRTDIAGLVQISDSTYNLVASTNFKMEKRGEMQINENETITKYLVYPDETLGTRIDISSIDAFSSNMLLADIIKESSASILKTQADHLISSRKATAVKLLTNPL